MVADNTKLTIDIVKCKEEKKKTLGISSYAAAGIKLSKSKVEDCSDLPRRNSLRHQR
jgi:hypothetical protein